MELCSEALEETVTSEEAQHLFQMETCKFQEVETLAFFKLTFFSTTQAPPPIFQCIKLGSYFLIRPTLEDNTIKELSLLLEPLKYVIVRRELFFLDKRPIQFDCGKLQELAISLRNLMSKGHRKLIFTQMRKMLEALEVQRFDTPPITFLFFLSTVSGGIGINLTGIDTIILYDIDWNLAID